MEKIVVANLKMNLNLEQIKLYINEIDGLINSNRVIICPSYIYIPYFLNKNYLVGTQNIASTEDGAYTGEVSASQVSSMNIPYTIVGHSERRSIFNETSVEVNKKVKLALSNNLKVILCIGETKEEKDNGLTNSVLSLQLKESLLEIDANLLENVIIAYEPVWSIGTGNIPTNEDIIEITNYIKSTVNNIYNNLVNIPVLYGGSVNEKNIFQLNEINEIDGVLVGGASLSSSKLNIIKEVVIK